MLGLYKGVWGVWVNLSEEFEFEKQFESRSEYDFQQNNYFFIGAAGTSFARAYFCVCLCVR